MKKSFIIYLDNLGVLDLLTDEQAGKLFKAIRVYQEQGAESADKYLADDKLLSVAFFSFRTAFERDDDKYNTRLVNGSKGGRPRKNQSKKNTSVEDENTDSFYEDENKTENDLGYSTKPNKTETQLGYFEKPNKTENDLGFESASEKTETHDNDNDNDNDNVNDNDIVSSADADVSECDSDSPKPKPISYSDIAKFWNKSVQDTAIPAITGIADGTQRRSHVKARIAEHGIDAVYQAITNVSQSNFLKGKNTKGFVAKFDWVFLPNNFVKVLEGNYAITNQSYETNQADKFSRRRGTNTSATSGADYPDSL